MLDVDSTLIQQEVIELLAERAGVRDQVETITQAAMNGQIDFSESLRERVALLAGVRETVFEEVLSEITVTSGVTELISFAHQNGGKVGVVSGGFNQVLGPLALRLGLDFSKANELEVKDGVLTGKVIGDIVDAQTKADCLSSWASELSIPINRTVAIGDGANDIEMLKVAGLAVAFRPKPVLRSYADLVIEENSLVGVIEAIREKLGTG